MRARARAAALLHATLVVAGPEAAAQLKTVLPGCVRAIRDKEAGIAELVAKCVRAIGHFVPIDSWLAAILPALTGRPRRIAAAGKHRSLGR